MKTLLVVWNPFVNNEGVKKTLYKFLEKNTSDLTFDFAQNQKELDERLNDKALNSKYFALIVLCELNWEGKKYSDFYGIDLVQQHIRVKHNNLKAVNLPILFVSFCNKNLIIEKDTSKEIINTYGLGNHFIQLPHAKEIELTQFWKMPLVSELELVDNLHFCSLDKMVAAIRHGIPYSSVDILKLRLTDIISKATGFDLSEISKKLDFCSTKDEIKLICDLLESKFVSNILSSDNVQNSTEYSVLLVDDEDTSDLKKLITEAKKYNITIIHKKRTDEALKEIEEDFGNKYAVIISDYRIYDKPEDLNNRVALYPQGYTFVEQVSKSSNLYKYISFSGLPRTFRIAVAERLNVKIETVDKELMIGSEQGRKSFIDKIIDLAEENLDQMCSMASKDYYFRTMYKRIITEKISVEELISGNAKELIEQLIQVQDISDSENIFGRYWEANKYRFSLQSETDLSKPDGVYYVEELCKLYTAILYEFNGHTNSNINNLLELNNIVFNVTQEGTKNASIFKNLYNALDEYAKKCFFLQIEKNTTNHFGMAMNAFKEIKKDNGSLNNLKAQFPNSSKRSKDPYSREALDQFVGKLAARRFVIYCFYWLNKKYSTGNLPKGLKGLNHAVNKLLVNGHLNMDPKKNKKDNNICNKIFITAKKGRRDVSDLKAIAMTNEEKTFFRTNYPELYDSWND